jgi:hypothetical protein
MRDAATPDLPSRSEDPWVESRAGGLFFVNALLAAPALMVLYPFLLRAVLRAAVGFDRPSPLLDTVPLVAAHVAPVVGWLALPAAALVVWNLRMVERRWARVLLWSFLVLHLGVLVYTAARWIG